MGALAVRFGRADVVGVRAFAAAQQVHGRFVADHQEGSGPFTDVDPIAVAAERIAQSARHGFERREARHRHAGQRIGATDNDGIADSGFDQASTGSEHLGARRAGRGDRVGGPRDAKHQRGKVRQRADFPLAIVGAGRPFAGARAIRPGLFMFVDCPTCSVPRTTPIREATMAVDRLVDGGRICSMAASISRLLRQSYAAADGGEGGSSADTSPTRTVRPGNRSSRATRPRLVPWNRARATSAWPEPSGVTSPMAARPRGRRAVMIAPPIEPQPNTLRAHCDTSIARSSGPRVANPRLRARSPCRRAG